MTRPRQVGLWAGVVAVTVAAAHLPSFLHRLLDGGRLRDGVPIDEETWREIVAAARGLNVLIEAPNKSA